MLSSVSAWQLAASDLGSDGNLGSSSSSSRSMEIDHYTFEENTTDEQLCAYVTQNRDLQGLDISSCKNLTDTSLHAIAGLTRLTTFKSSSFCPFTENAYIQLFRSLNNLTSLRVCLSYFDMKSQVHHFKSDRVIAALPTTLETLYLYGLGGISDARYSLLGSLRLKDLSLVDAITLGNDGLEGISGNTQLESLYISGDDPIARTNCPLNDEGLRCLMKQTKLRKLNIQGTSASDKAVAKIKQALKIEYSENRQ